MGERFIGTPSWQAVAQSGHDVEGLIAHPVVRIEEGQTQANATNQRGVRRVAAVAGSSPISGRAGQAKAHVKSTYVVHQYLRWCVPALHKQLVFAEAVNQPPYRK